MPKKILTINTDNKMFSGAEYIEDIFCLATLIAAEELDSSATMETIDDYYQDKMEGSCWNCHYRDRCLACIINE